MKSNGHFILPGQLVNVKPWFTLSLKIVQFSLVDKPVKCATQQNQTSEIVNMTGMDRVINHNEHEDIHAWEWNVSYKPAVYREKTMPFG